jgi:protein gp37
MSQTKIEWAEKTWNPVTGCTKVSPACDNCYAERISKRLAGRYGYPKDKPFRVTFHSDKLNEPHKWKKRSRIFVVSMGDLFHEKVENQWRHLIFNEINAIDRHTYIILTKRPQNALNYITKNIREHGWGPLPNHIWLGVTAENQEQADKRIPILLQIPAAVRFVSIEPMLGYVEISNFKGIDWVIVGAESGPKRR